MLSLFIVNFLAFSSIPLHERTKGGNDRATRDGDDRGDDIRIHSLQTTFTVMTQRQELKSKAFTKYMHSNKNTCVYAWH